MREMVIDQFEILTVIHTNIAANTLVPSVGTALAQWMEFYITDLEIEEYAQSFITPAMILQGYSVVDYENARIALYQFRDEYCNQ
jgi:hypothetical protein